MRRSPWFVFVGVLYLLTECSGPASAAGTYRRLVPIALVYADVTSSLRFSEVEDVARLTSSIVLALRPGTKYWIYPIQSDARHIPLFFGTVPATPETFRDRAPYLKKCKDFEDAVRAEIQRQYCLVNYPSGRRPVQCPPSSTATKAQIDNRSCILASIREAARRLDDYREVTRGSAEIIFVSDMIEECEATPSGGSVKLNRRDIRTEIAAVPNYRGLPDLHGSFVTVVIPYDEVATPEAKTSRPDGTQLEDYWRAVFKAAKADMSHFYFNTMLPRRFTKDQ
jgi:hypothetical protein